MGNQAEKRFVQLCHNRKFPLRPATKNENMVHHFDYVVQDANDRFAKIEVKAMKAARRGMQPSPHIIYVELKNIHGGPGWIYGKADYIAFEQPNGFLLVDRLQLLDLVERIQPTCRKAAESGIRRTLYSRRDRDDLVLVLYMDDIRHLTKNVFLQV
jgi:hypothetical protein